MRRDIEKYRNQPRTLSWLLMMQHYGAPTRLLDWTTNILVALYFAVGESEEDLSQDGEVWCLHAQGLNNCSNKYICAPDDDAIKALAAQAFLAEDELFRFGVKGGWPTLPLALIPPLEFPRLGAQMSRFTVHPSPAGRALIEFLLRDDKHLVRYIIPAEIKGKLKKDLAALGFSRDTLFHDLESLASTICQEIVQPDFDLQGPPHFDDLTSS